MPTKCTLRRALDDAEIAYQDMVETRGKPKFDYCLRTVLEKFRNVDYNMMSLYRIKSDFNAWHSRKIDDLTTKLPELGSLFALRDKSVHEAPVPLRRSVHIKAKEDIVLGPGQHLIDLGTQEIDGQGGLLHFTNKVTVPGYDDRDPIALCGECLEGLRKIVDEVECRFGTVTPRSVRKMRVKGRDGKA